MQVVDWECQSLRFPAQAPAYALKTLIQVDLEAMLPETSYDADQ